MKIQELIKQNRSYRRFDETKKISTEQLKNFVESARLSASPKNLQSLKYILSNNKDKNAEIFSTLAWAGYLKEWDGPTQGERPSAYIIIVNDKKISSNPLADWVYTASGIALQSILLTATEAGYGGCVIAAIQKQKLAKILSLEPQYEILLVLALGKPTENIILKDIEEGEDIKYYRDEKGNHYVPKRQEKEIIIKTYE